ncbi:TrbI/VirB10 family protein [Burkholderia glumae]|uniref:TrbI/VirB10 family protein n=1 Tax=Burkholderia glumae TaxID=337 RepID=UPI0003F50D6C|nr:TrbI/VirB10 family protein [Burkholderia glumae]QKM57786.1 hypothetical protein CG017_05866 [Burkholderia glumae]
MSDVNQTTKRRQQVLLGVGLVIVVAGLLGGIMFTQDGSRTRTVTTKLPMTSVGDQNDRNVWRSQSEAQLQAMTQQLSQANSQAKDAAAKLDALAKAQEDLQKKFDEAQKREAQAASSAAAASAGAASRAGQGAKANSADRSLLDKPLPLNGSGRGRILNPPFGSSSPDVATAAPPSLDIIQFDPPAKPDSDKPCVDPRFSSLPLDEARQAQQDCLKSKGKKGVTFIPATSFVRVFMLNGVDAPTGGEAQHDPLPVFLQVLDPANLPNGRKLDIRECRILSSAWGDVSSERTHMHGVTLDCILKSGRTVEMAIKGNVIGEDGKEGVRGRLVSKAGSALAMSVLAGISQGIGQAFNESSNTLSTTALGATSIINPSQIGRAAIGSGVAGGADSLKQYYIRAAEKLFPVIETDGGRVVEFAVTMGAEYDGPLSDVSDMNDAIDRGGDRAHGGYSDE